MDSLLTSALCPAAKFYGPTLYSLFKTIVYLILGCRIWISFKGSMYAYGDRNLTIWGIIISVWTLFTIIAGNATVTSVVESQDGDTKCIVNPSFIYIISQALLDLTAGIVNCVLFVKPICKLYNLTIESGDGDGLRIKTLAYKQCILSMIAILSSIVSMFGIAVFGDIVPVFVASDMFLSAICIILMYKWNKFITDALFCCCLPSESRVADVTNLGMNAVPSKTGNGSRTSKMS